MVVGRETAGRMPQQSESVSGNEAKGLTPISAQTASNLSTCSGALNEPALANRVDEPLALGRSTTGVSNQPQTEDGIFHLTQGGWIRADSGAPPSGRLESWTYHLERPSFDSKDEVTLTRVWMAQNLTDAQSVALHSKHGEAIEATLDRNVVLDCHV